MYESELVERGHSGRQKSGSLSLLTIFEVMGLRSPKEEMTKKGNERAQELCPGAQHLEVSREEIASQGTAKERLLS